MGVSIGHWLKGIIISTLIAAVFLVAFVGTQPAKVEAAANLTAYVTAPPSSWEPARYNVTGSAPWFVVQMLGYNATSTMGNLGIGDGSTETLKNLSNLDVEYSENYLIGADISMAPWNSSRITSSPAIMASLESNETTGNETGAKGVGTSRSGNRTCNGLTPYQNVCGVTMAVPHNACDHSTADTENSGNETTKSNETTEGAHVTRQGPYTPLNDQYHPILMGRPVDDLPYEYPLEIIGGMYARLVGLRMPCGSVANMGIRCLGYGY